MRDLTDKYISPIVCEMIGLFMLEKSQENDIFIFNSSVIYDGERLVIGFRVLTLYHFYVVLFFENINEPIF